MGGCLGEWCGGSWPCGWVGREASIAFVCRCIRLSWESDTGPDKAHVYWWEGKERGGELALTMGFRPSSSGEGRTNPWLVEKQEIAEAVATKKAKGGNRKKLGAHRPSRKVGQTSIHIHMNHGQGGQ